MTDTYAAMRGQEFERLYRRYCGPVRAYVERRTGDDAVDAVLAETWLAAWRSWAELPPYPLPWLYGTAHGLLARPRRRRLLRKRSAVAPAQDPRGSPLRAALATLSEDDREVLMLIAWEGLAHSAAAQVLDCSTGAVGVRLHRARRRLARALEAMPQDSDLLERLAAEDPAHPARHSRNAAILAAVLAAAGQIPAPHRRRHGGLRVALVGALVFAVAAALVLAGTQRGDRSLDAAARTYAALTAPRGIYHFVSISTLTQRPRKATRLGIGFRFQSRFPLVLGGDSLHRILGHRQYEEDWITLDGRRIHWRKYRTRGGRRGPLHAAAALTQDPPDPLTDPATAFRTAYRAHQLRSGGPVIYRGSPAWRFVDRRQEWIVDRHDWLPLRYSYVETGRAYGLRYTNRETIRFLKFEVLPLTDKTQELLNASPADRRVGPR